ncbi:respiratory nitrate reductase subunit gamma [Patulibacter sp. SYSU D01012]|uniref:respiratory nitrate reductase subunit gamma n=1 Tax=Patulibacter sp. SYSU D01012 TaxID=2817381 RepID=UPI001B307FA8|nr:respiratory nitrate reductase subunit gamma [Patulibacter sp. SYSU D01012]
MSRLDVLLFVVLPYVCLTTFVVGHVWRWRHDQLAWTTRSTQLLEGRWLRIGINLFHYGMVAVIFGHLVGLLIPESATEAIGMSEHAYHTMAVYSGLTVGLVMVVGFLILIVRRTAIPRVRRTTSRTDHATYALLLIAMGTGMWCVIGENIIGDGHNYRETVSPWFRGLFLMTPRPEALLEAPLLYQLHAMSTMALFALWPFSRLVHAWSLPLGYLSRAHVLYRRRAPRPSHPRLRRPAASVAPTVPASTGGPAASPTVGTPSSAGE